MAQSGLALRAIGEHEEYTCILDWDDETIEELRKAWQIMKNMPPLVKELVVDACFDVYEGAGIFDDQGNDTSYPKPVTTKDVYLPSPCRLGSARLHINCMGFAYLAFVLKHGNSTAFESLDAIDLKVL